MGSTGMRLPCERQEDSGADTGDHVRATFAEVNGRFSVVRRGQERVAAVELGNTVIIDNLAELALDQPGASAAAVYDRPIGLWLLYEDPESGQEHYLVRYPAGVRGRVHQHSAAHTIVVLEGMLDANGTVIGPGAYAHFPARQPMRHQATEHGSCLFVLIFHAPFDVEVVDDITGRHPPNDAT